MDRVLTSFEFIVKNGPWALIVIIMLAWLAGDYGLLESQSKASADAIKAHSRETQATTRVLENIVDILEEQRRIQSQAAMLACLKEAKADYERTDCVKKFSVSVIPKR